MPARAEFFFTETVARISVGEALPEPPQDWLTAEEPLRALKEELSTVTILMMDDRDAGKGWVAAQVHIAAHRQKALEEDT